MKNYAFIRPLWRSRGRAQDLVDSAAGRAFSWWATKASEQPLQSTPGFGHCSGNSFSWAATTATSNKQQAQTK